MTLLLFKPEEFDPLKHLLTLALVSAALCGTAVQAVAQPAYPDQPPELGPPPPPPGPPAGFVLEPGHWQWDGYRYHWVRRHWIATQPGYAHFVPGHWRPNGSWAPPHWVG